MSDFLGTRVEYFKLGAPATSPSIGRSLQEGPGGGAVAAAEPSDNRYLKVQKELGELCKRRFFFRQAFDIYGGIAGFYTYGPPGCAVKNNIIRAWRRHFVTEEGLLEVEDTCIMPHAVLKASGHVDRFNDLMVKDLADESRFFRADKLLEEVMDSKLEEPGITEAQKTEYISVRNQADAFSKEEIHQVFQKYGIKAPDTGTDLSEPYEFNLMFPTDIGPDGYLQGYLRPETAQGIFLNYKFCIEQNSNRLPFGVAQVGRAFRNEIAPQKGLTRQREFTQAEIEYFVNPKNKAHPKWSQVKNLRVTFFHRREQVAAKGPMEMTMDEALKNNVIANETLGFYMSRTFLFLRSIGIKKEHLRFRQHLEQEMAHYAEDCWDAEIYTSYGWLECVGIADRSCYDLNAHAKAAKTDLTYKEQLEKPIEREVLVLTKKSEIAVMKAFGKAGKMVKEELCSMDQPQLKQIEAALQAMGSTPVTINGEDYTLKSDDVVFERKTEKVTVNAFTPGVIEPSFGIDRIFFAVIEHIYYARPKDEKDAEDDKLQRGVLAFEPIIAPYKLTVLPLDNRISRHEKYASMLVQLRRELSSLGLSCTVDESGATIGRRYARNDELGVPFALTMDFTTLEDGTATLRDRDTMDQLRLPLQVLAELIRDLISGEAKWEEQMARFPHRRTGQEEWTNP